MGNKMSGMLSASYPLAHEVSVPLHSGALKAVQYNQCLMPAGTNCDMPRWAGHDQREIKCKVSLSNSQWFSSPLCNDPSPKHQATSKGSPSPSRLPLVPQGTTAISLWCGAMTVSQTYSQAKENSISWDINPNKTKLNLDSKGKWKHFKRIDLGTGNLDVRESQLHFAESS